MWLRYCLKLLLIFVSCVRSKEDPEIRIVGGYLDNISAVPYLVQLYIDNQFSCGGSLIKRNVVLTAAHCARGLKASQITIKGGATHLSDEGEKRGVKKIITSTQYNSSTLHMDVAILILKSVMSGNNIKTINLRTEGVPNGATVKVSGWGYTEDSGYVSNQVQSVELYKMGKDACKKFYADGLSDTMVCATRKDKDSCNGDSGGPLVYGNELFGIVSWGYACASEYPGVYTNVISNEVKTFIKNNVP